MNPDEAMTEARLEVFAATRRAIAEVRARLAVDGDGSLSDLWRVLRQKRGCRR